MFFWVFPRRQYVICRRFGTMYQFQLQRLEVDYFPPLKMELIHGFRNVGKLHIDAGEIPKRTYTIFKSRRKLEIHKRSICLPGNHKYQDLYESKPHIFFLREYNYNYVTHITCVHPVQSRDCFSKNSSLLTLRLLMSYIYGAPILDVSRSHTTTQHSR